MIIHLERLWSCKTVKIWKLHWKLRFSESQYCFANIFTTKAHHFKIWNLSSLDINWHKVNFHESARILIKYFFLPASNGKQTSSHMVGIHPPCKIWSSQQIWKVKNTCSSIVLFYFIHHSHNKDHEDLLCFYFYFWFPKISVQRNIERQINALQMLILKSGTQH